MVFLQVKIKLVKNNPHAEASFHKYENVCTINLDTVARYSTMSNGNVLLVFKPDTQVGMSHAVVDGESFKDAIRRKDVFGLYRGEG